MKKFVFLFVALGVIFSLAVAADGDYPKVKMSGKIYTYMSFDNNWDDYTSYDEDAYDDEIGNPTNDSRFYGQARVDLNFGVDVAENVYAKVSTRFEDNNDKWLNYGNGNEPTLADAKLYLQEAYVELRNILGQPLKFDMGRKQECFGAPGESNFGNIVAGRDKLDGIKFAYDNSSFYANLHYYIRERAGDVGNLEGERNSTLYGINGGIKNRDFIENLNVYIWHLSNPGYKFDDLTEEAYECRTVFGLRSDMSFMDGFITPFIEFAMQTGTMDEGYYGVATDIDENAMLLDVGTGLEKEMNGFTLDGSLRYLYFTGDDADTADNVETWQGVGLSNWEEGWMLWDPIMNGWNMFRAEAGFTPASMDKLRLALTFWMYTDATQNNDDASGENVCNELALWSSYSMAKNVDLYLGFSMQMPNEDYAGGKDNATGLWFETDVKW